MTLMHRAIIAAPLFLAAAGCAQGHASVDGGPPGPDSNSDVDASCGEFCDQDNDGVLDPTDECANTPAGDVVNDVGCSDSQVSPTLEPTFPPYGLTWTPTGDLGRAGGLTWTYTGIDRADLFHIYWVVCDDPATPCGLSLDGPLDAAGENWQFNVGASNPPGGRLVFTATTHIALADATTPQLNARLTVTIVDGTAAAIAFDTVVALAIPARSGTYGAEIPATGFQVVALAEVQDPSTLAWSPYLDYYDAAPTPDPGPGTATSFGGSFYDE